MAASPTTNYTAYWANALDLQPTSSGQLELQGGVSLHWELFGLSSGERIMFTKGGLGKTSFCKGFFKELIGAGYQVLVSDYRGTCASTAPLAEGKTSVYAADCMAIVDSVFGADARFHLIGASLGGAVAQEMAYALAARGQAKRLLSMYLIIAPTGTWLRPPPGLRAFLIRLYLKGLVALPTPEAKLLSMVPSFLTPEVAASVDCFGSGATTGEALARELAPLYDAMMWDSPLDEASNHMAALLGHYLSPARAAVITKSGVPIGATMTGKDTVISSAQQERLAKLLAVPEADITRFQDCNHMQYTLLHWRERGLNACLAFLAKHRVTKG